VLQVLSLGDLPEYLENSVILGEDFYLRGLPVKWLMVAGLGFQCLFFDQESLPIGDLLVLGDLRVLELAPLPIEDELCSLSIGTEGLGLGFELVIWRELFYLA
jgi:hypothetical protein